MKKITIKSYSFPNGESGDDLLEDGIFENENEWRTFTFYHDGLIDFTLLVHSDYKRGFDEEPIKKAVIEFFETYERELEKPTSKKYAKQYRRPIRITRKDRMPFPPKLAWLNEKGVIEWKGVTKYFSIDVDGVASIDLIAKHEQLENNALDKAVDKFAEIYLQEMHILTK